jgi:hypothetical protein
MNYLVEMKLANSSRPIIGQDGITFIEQYILPTLELCKKLEAEKKIVAGGPLSGGVALSLIVNVESAQDLDSVITTLPVWPLMETSVIPMTTFDGRIQAVRTLLEQVRAQLHDGAGRAA